MNDEERTSAAEDDEQPIEQTGAGASKGEVGPGVATDEENAKLEHTMGGSTTRDDANDLGVPMLQGDGSERQGPEDALGEGPKRGDYRERIGPDNYHPHETKIDPETGATVVEAQRPRTEDIGDVKGKKGGVETTSEDEAA